MQFADKLKKLRKETNMTQFELAEKLLVSRQSISKWETGIAFPDIENMVAIGNLFGVSLDYLANEEYEEDISMHYMNSRMSKMQKNKNVKWLFIFLIVIIGLILVLVSRNLHITLTISIFAFWSMLLIVLVFVRKLCLSLLSKSFNKRRENRENNGNWKVQNSEFRKDELEDEEKN